MRPLGDATAVSSSVVMAGGWERGVPAEPAPDTAIASCPVGSVVQTSVGREGLSTATYDSTGQYRFRLSRVWDQGGRRCVFAMLNPSTATAATTDATATRCARFAQSWGFGALEIVNLFAYRCPSPEQLYRHADPVGPGNDVALVAAARCADLCVAAWGVHSALHGRGRQVTAMLTGAGVTLHCVRVTKDGLPGHPLYVRADAALQPW